MLRLIGLDQITIEHDIGGALQAALGQVHQQEGEVVKHVARRDQRAELDGVEQHRAAVEQGDVAEVQVAVDVANEAASPTLDEKRTNARIFLVASQREHVE